MNLGQLVDPAWVWARFPERRDTTAAPAHGRAAGMRHRIREVLDRSKNPLNAGEIRATAPELSAMQIGANLGAMFVDGQVSREGARGRYRYRLTARGRAHVT